MKKRTTKLLAGVLALSGCLGLSACELVDKGLQEVTDVLFCDIRLEGEPTWKLLEEADGEYTIIIEGYAKNYSDRTATRSEAVADLYDENGEGLDLNRRLVSDIDRIGEGEVWHFYIVEENFPAKPASFQVKVFEDF